MSNLKANKNKFDNLIQAKISNHETQPSVDSWIAIEKRLNKKSNKRIWWLYSTAASVLLLVSIWFFNPNQSAFDTVLLENETSNPNSNFQAEQNPLNVISIDHLDDLNQTQVDFNKNSKSKKSLLTTNASISNTGQLSTELSQTKFENSEFLDDSLQTHTNLLDNIVEKQKLVTAEKLHKSKIVNNLTELHALEDPTPTNDLDVKKKLKKSWGLRLGAGTGTMALNTAQQVPPLMRMINNTALLNDVWTYIPTPDEFVKRHYSMPVALNLLVSKRFTDKISLESGLTFSSLRTDFSEYKWGNMNATMQLYYIGFPFRINLLMAEIDHLKLGLSTGLKFEKGLQSVYTQNLYFNGSSHFTQVKETIPGQQFSAMLGADFSYGISRYFDLYFAPTMEYYPNNNQPLSIRTEMPLQISLQLGLKYKI